MISWKNNVYFVLVEPREPGNIGAAARAIKNMDFRNLCLTDPVSFMTEEARWFARNAIDTLGSASVFPSLNDAVRDKHYIVGTSRRRGRRRGAFLPVEEGVRRVYETAQTNRVAILFGREDRGLYNEEIEGCGFLMTIPASKKQPSLNLAQAVMVIAYELSKAGMEEGPREDKDGDYVIARPPKYVNQQELSCLYDRMEKILSMIEYIPREDIRHKKKIMQNLKHCLGRAGLTDWEYNMFHGICKHFENKIMGGRS